MYCVNFLNKLELELELELAVFVRPSQRTAYVNEGTIAGTLVLDVQAVLCDIYENKIPLVITLSLYARCHLTLVLSRK